MLKWKPVFGCDFRRDFANYADVCFKEFGDRVSQWTTLNEANVFAIGGYDLGGTPPGRCSAPFGFFCTKGNSSTEPYIVGHNLLLAHASVVKLYRRKYKVSLLILFLTESSLLNLITCIMDIKSQSH